VQSTEIDKDILMRRSCGISLEPNEPFTCGGFFAVLWTGWLSLFFLISCFE
jgi:hypothetical protein